MKVHITNGVYFNEWLMKQTGYSSIPFNEAMMSGTVTGNPFDEEFIKHRAECHHVSCEEYCKTMGPFLELLNHVHQMDEIILWFGHDAFCQMNILTILKTLELFNYQGIVKTIIFDEHEDWNLVLDQRPVLLNWRELTLLYEPVLIRREFIVCDNEIMNHAIALYLDLHNEHGRLMQMIGRNSEMSEMDLVRMLMEHSKEEGLSDVQALEMIRKVRTKK